MITPRALTRDLYKLTQYNLIPTPHHIAKAPFLDNMVSIKRGVFYMLLIVAVAKESCQALTRYIMRQFRVAESEHAVNVSACDQYEYVSVIHLANSWY